jgi:hypothetical protein
MSNYQRTIAARERSARIREAREAVRERVTRREDTATIREYLKHGTDGGVA